MTCGYGIARVGVLFVIALLATALAGCGTMQQARTEAAAERTEPLTDGEIVAVLHALNQGEIRHADLAMQKSRDPEVLDTAITIITDHLQSNQRAMALAGAADIQLQENALSRSIRQQAQQMEEQLRGLSGREFDRAYLQGQMRMHQLAIETVEDELLPAAQDARLKQLLTAATPKLRQHLQEARRSRQSPPRA